MHSESLAIDTDIADITRQAINTYGLQQVPAEFSAFLQRIRELNPAAVLEIGTAKGASIWAISQVCPPDALIMTMDIKPVMSLGPFRSASRLPLAVGPSFRLAGRTVYRLVGDSQSPAMRQVVETLMVRHQRTTLDLLFIDGDHSEAGVRADFQLYWPLVRSGGLVAFHDIVDTDWNREHGNFIYPLWHDLQADPGWQTEMLKDLSDTLYHGVSAHLQMGIGAAVKSGELPVQEASASASALRWMAYQLQFVLRVLRHLLKGGLRRLGEN